MFEFVFEKFCFKTLQNPSTSFWKIKKQQESYNQTNGSTEIYDGLTDFRRIHEFYFGWCFLSIHCMGEGVDLGGLKNEYNRFAAFYVRTDILWWNTTNPYIILPLNLTNLERKNWSLLFLAFICLFVIFWKIRIKHEKNYHSVR